MTKFENHVKLLVSPNKPNACKQLKDFEKLKSML